MHFTFLFLFKEGAIHKWIDDSCLNESILYRSPPSPTGGGVSRITCRFSAHLKALPLVPSRTGYATLQNTPVPERALAIQCPTISFDPPTVRPYSSQDTYYFPKFPLGHHVVSRRALYLSPPTRRRNRPRCNTWQVPVRLLLLLCLSM